MLPGGLAGFKPGGTFLICNEVNGDTDKRQKWTEIIDGMTIYKDTGAESISLSKRAL